MRKLFIPLVAITMFGCSQDEPCTTPETRKLQLNVPNDQVTLQTVGRVLFYDTRLSDNNQVSCASCHKQSLAFADNVDFSTGFQGHKTLRNSIAINDLFNSGFGGPVFGERLLFWDGRETSLNNMVLQPILNHVEMGMADQQAVLARVKSAGYYRELFSQAKGSDEEITVNDISMALTQFVSGIQSNQTKFDLVQRGQATFDHLEQTGNDLFFNIYPCGSCHTPQTPYNVAAASSFLDIGLDNNPGDIGRAAVTGLPADVGRFRVPSLKNVALTAPYMHDGRFNTLEEVLDHYSTGIKQVTNLDQRLLDNTGHALKLNITEDQKKALVAFLGTLTDVSSINAESLSDPFSH